jgi:type I restriction enzyme, S subunit
VGGRFVSGAPKAVGTELRRFKQYPVYKDSGVEWPREIPSAWQLLKLKRICRFAYGDALASDMREEGDVQVYGSNGPVGKHDRANTLAPCIVIGRKGSFGKVNFSPRAVFAIDTTFFVDRRFTSTDLRWLYYVLLNARLDSESKDSAVPGLDREDAYTQQVSVGSESEQRAIAAFLDRETAKIDASVAKKERLIELLLEKRAALITRAVTKGLDPNVPMKDSGVEWLGAVPAHWDVERVKWVARMESGHTPDKKVDSYWVGGNIPWVSLADTGQLREVDYIEDTAVRTTSDGIAHSSARILPPGTVVFSRDATIGLCAITRVPMAVSQHFIGWVCGPRLEPEYLLFAFRSMTQELERLTMGATVRTIGMPDVRSLITPVPPVSEQEKIVVYVRESRTQIGRLVEKIQGVIDRLREIRAALISAAVTGKIDVREEIA